MATYIHPAPHRVALPTRAPARIRVIPRTASRVGTVVSGLGLTLALVSLFLPWLVTSGGRSITALGITEIIDMRSVSPVLFLGLLSLLFLVAVTAATRLGAFAVAGAVVGGIILLAHLTFMWTLVSSTGPGEPMIAGIPSGSAISYGPYVAAVGFVLVTAGATRAAVSAGYDGPEFVLAGIRSDG